MTIKLVLADDHAVVRDGIKSVLSRKNNEFVVVGEAENGKELVDLADKVNADVYNDKFYLCPRVSKYVVEGFLGQVDVDSVARKTNNLTPKEREILQLIAEGFSSKDIALRHNLSLNTIHVHRNNIMRKLDIHKQADLIRYAIKEGIAHL